MKKGWKSSVALLAKIIIIIVLPLVLFRYVDSQPVTVVNEEPDEATRNIAIVNEDNGYVIDDEIVTFSSEIAPLLREQVDYTWTVVNRSNAEQGLNNQVYDAIIYIPSAFSDQVMSFNHESPQKAAINYVVQPSLDAKNYQRVEKEMARATNTINQEMSTIYWSYVSQEIDFIRNQFDNILEKEIDFQEAMHSFYAPSSRTLAQEIEYHKNNLENILNQTGNIHEQSEDSVDVATEAMENLTEFAEALDDYKNHQVDQQQLLYEFQTDSRKAIDTGVIAYETVMSEVIHDINRQIYEYESPVFLEDEPEQEDFIIVEDGMKEVLYSLNEGKNQFDSWKQELDDMRDGRTNDKWLQLFEMHEKLLTLYNKELLYDGLMDVLVSANDLRKDEPEDEEPFPDIEEPEQPELPQQINIDTLRNNASDLRVLFEQAKPSDPPPGGNRGDHSNSNKSKDVNQDRNSDPWEAIESGLDELDNSILILDNDIAEFELRFGEWSEYANEWKEVTEQWKKAYIQLRKNQKELSTALVDTIFEQQTAILNHEMFDERNLEKEEFLQDIKEQLEEYIFYQKGKLANKDVTLLITYGNTLSVLQKTLDQKNSLLEKLMEIYNYEEMRELRREFISLDDLFREEFNDMFSFLLGDEELEITGKIPEMELSFDNLIHYTEKFLDDYEILIDEEFETIEINLDDMASQANDIVEQLHIVNAETYEWEQSPSLGLLNEQMVVFTHERTLSDLQQLLSLVSSLNESQDNITNRTNELHLIVGEVQQRSDDLNERWSTNVHSTELVREDVHNVLANTFVDGQENPYVYSHLANPVNVEGRDGRTGSQEVMTETETRLPPVIMLVAILISGLLIGFISHFYSNSNYFVQGGLFVLLNLATGLIISIYGLNIYNLDDAMAIQWSLFTILLLLSTSNIVRAGLFIHTFVGWLTGIALIVFFITPMIDIVVPDFSFDNPIARVYMGLQYGVNTPYSLTMVILGMIILLVSAFIYTLQVMRKRPKVVPDEKAAS